MNFRKRIQIVASGAVVSPAAGPNTVVTIPITREFFLEKLRVAIQFDFTLGTATTPCTDTFANLLQRARVTVTDGGEQKTVVDVTGAALLDYAMNAGTMDLNTAIAWGVATTQTARIITFDIPFTPQGLEGNLSQFFLLPLPRYNSDPVLELTFAGSVAQFFSTPGTGAFANVSFVVEAHKREVPDIGFQTYSSELVELTQSFPSTGANQQYFIQTPGAFTIVMLRPYDSVQFQRLPTMFGLANEIELNVLDVRLRRERANMIYSLNQQSWATANIPPALSGAGGPVYAAFDFLSDDPGVQAENLGGLLETNELAFTGVRPILLMNIAVAGTLKVLTHRIFGDISPLKPMLKA